METLLNIIVVGYGLAGQVHAKTYRNLVGSCHLAAIIECSLELHPVITKEFPGVKAYESLEQALADIDRNVVVDLCVPAPQNINLAKTAIAFGVQKMMLEKPLGWSLPMAMDLADVLRDREIHYLDTYRFSLGIKQLRDWIVSEQSEIDQIHIKFNKNRITDSFNGRGFDKKTSPDAWHIEGPHMVTIAMMIAGEIAVINEASLKGMTHNNRTLHDHGGASAEVEHSNGVQTFLSMDLCSHENERLVEVFLKNKVSFRLRLPASKVTRLVSHIEKVSQGHVVDTFTVEDRPMEQCVSHSVEYFLTKNNNVQMMEQGIRVSEILQELTDASKQKVCCNF